MALFCIICEIKRNIGQKSWFFIPLAFGAPVRGSPSEYCHPVWYGKTRMVGLPEGEKVLRICITVYTQYTGVWQRDRRTYRQTDRHLATAVRAMHMRRAVKNKQFCLRRLDAVFRVSRRASNLKNKYKVAWRRMQNHWLTQVQQPLYRGLPLFQDNWCKPL